MIQGIIRPDKKWIEKIKKGGKEGQLAESKLYEKYTYFVRRGMRKFQISEDEALDTYIDAFTECVQQVVSGQFRENSSFKSYLFSIFNNKVVDTFRKKTTTKSRIHRWLDELVDVHHDGVRNTLQKLIDIEDIEQLKKEIQQLGNACQQILLDAAMGYSLAEIAIRLNPPLKNAATVKTQKYRCLNKLKNRMGISI